MSNFVLFTKRTDFPKLGFIIDQLTRHGIPCRINGESFHAPILEVSEAFEADAWALLDAPAADYGIPEKGDLDAVEDDHPFFSAFAEGLALDPEFQSANEEAEWYEELNRGYAMDRA